MTAEGPLTDWRFDHVRIERSLNQESTLPSFAALLLEDLYELAPYDFAFSLGVATSCRAERNLSPAATL